MLPDIDGHEVLRPPRLWRRDGRDSAAARHAALSAAPAPPSRLDLGQEIVEGGVARVRRHGIERDAQNILLLIIGCFLEVVGALLLVMPILAPVLAPLGVDAVHFGIIFTHNMEVGLVHPPVGLNLYVLSTISDAPIGEVIRGILPFLIILLLVLGLITYWPAPTFWLPNLVFGP